MGFIGFVFDERHTCSMLGMIAHNAGKHHDCSTLRLNAPVIDRADREGVLGERAPVIAL